MTLNIDWRIPRIWKNENGFISTVEFIMEFTEDTYPGFKSVHGGIVSITYAALAAEGASREDIASAIMGTMTEGQFEHLAEFHLSQIQFEHERATNEEVEIDPIDTTPVFPNLSARQLRIGLITNGIDPDTVTATIAAMPEGTDKKIAQTEWEYASTFERDHHLITMVGSALGLTEEQIDTMWMAASEL